jgi:NADPH:quinone reductase-like Zn-dependent oxidoreductase
MQAIQLTRFGAPDRLQLVECARPRPGRGQYLVAVHAASVNPIDWKLRSGALRPFLWPRLPVVLGFDVCGVIAEAGPDAQRFAPGAAVYARLDTRYGGGYAQYAVVGEAVLAHKPNGLSDVQAASVPLAAVTALQALRDRARLRAGQHLLVVGGAGGVGHFAVQIGKALGAHVVASASAQNHDLLRELGAEHCIDYRSQPYRSFEAPYDVIFDTAVATSISSFLPLMAADGRYLAATPSLELIARAPVLALTSRQRIIFVMLKPSAADLDQLTYWIEAGQLKPVIDRTYPLAEVAAAHAYAEQGHVRGKVVLEVR